MATADERRDVECSESGAGFEFAIADKAGNEFVWATKSGAIGGSESVAELAALEDNTRCLGA